MVERVWVSQVCSLFGCDRVLLQLKLKPSTAAWRNLELRLRDVERCRKMLNWLRLVVSQVDVMEISLDINH